MTNVNGLYGNGTQALGGNSVHGGKKNSQMRALLLAIAIKETENFKNTPHLGDHLKNGNYS